MIKDPRRVAELAARRHDEQWRFRSFLISACRWPDSKLNQVALQLGRAAEAQIECTTCGICCRDNVVPVSDEEIARLAIRVRLPVAQFRARHVCAVDDDPQAIDASPCGFLCGTRCSVYEDRPDACRGYPYLEGDVRSRLVGMIERAGTCPIVFEQLERLKEATGFRRLFPRSDEEPAGPIPGVAPVRSPWREGDARQSTAEESSG